MEIKFKDEKLKKLAENIKKKSENNETEEKKEMLFIQEDVPDIFDEELIPVEKAMEIISSNDDKENEIEKNEEIKNSGEVKVVAETDIVKTKYLKEITKTIKKIESNQNIILEMLEYLPTTKIEETQMKPINKDSLEFLNYNLYTFNKKLIVISTSSKDKRVKKILTLLNKISDYILSNSFYIFTTERTPIKQALFSINELGLQSKINDSIMETEKLLNKIDKISSCDIFIQTYKYSTLLLEKGLLLQSIILLNEAISIYIVETAKGFSKSIEKYISIFGEENRYKLYSQAKTFFTSLFPNKESEKKKIIPFFPNHPYKKDIDEEIAKKFQNLNKTWQNRGGKNFFQQYTYLIDKVRDIRNNLAHGNMEIDFYDLKRDIQELIRDFEYLSNTKNIFKLKGIKK